MNYIVFSGGGSNGILHIGAWAYFLAQQVQGWKPKGIAGTSIGSILALFIVLGFTPEELLIAFLRGVKMMRTESEAQCTVIDPVKTTEFILSEISRKGITNPATVHFSQLFARTGIELVICATNLCTGTETLFTHQTHPTVLIIDAIRASIAIPVVFPPVRIQSELYVDGGLVQNIIYNYFPLAETCFFWVRIKLDYLRTDVLLSSTYQYFKRILLTTACYPENFIKSKIEDAKCFELPHLLSVVEMEEQNWFRFIEAGVNIMRKEYKKEFIMILFTLLFLRILRTRCFFLPLTNT